MITVWLHLGKTQNERIEDYHKPMGEVVLDLLKYWHEGEGPQLYWLQDEDGTILATVFRGDTEESALVTYSDGTLERYNVEYVLDDGSYVGTLVNRLDSEGNSINTMTL